MATDTDQRTDLDVDLESEPRCEIPHEVLMAAGLVIPCTVTATHRLFVRCLVDSGVEVLRPMICSVLVDWVEASQHEPCVGPNFVPSIKPHLSAGCWTVHPL